MRRILIGLTFGVVSVAGAGTAMADINGTPDPAAPGETVQVTADHDAPPCALANNSSEATLNIIWPDSTVTTINGPFSNPQPIVVPPTMIPGTATIEWWKGALGGGGGMYCSGAFEVVATPPVDALPFSRPVMLAGAGALALAAGTTIARRRKTAAA